MTPLTPTNTPKHPQTPTKHPQTPTKSGATTLSWKSGWKPTTRREFCHLRIIFIIFRFRVTVVQSQRQIFIQIFIHRIFIININHCLFHSQRGWNGFLFKMPLLLQPFPQVSRLPATSDTISPVISSGRDQGAPRKRGRPAMPRQDVPKKLTMKKGASTILSKAPGGPTMAEQVESFTKSHSRIARI